MRGQNNVQPFKSIHYGMKGRLVCTYLYSIEAQIYKKHGGKRQKPRGYRDWYQDALRSSDCSYSCVTRYVIVRFGVSLFEFGVSLLEFGEFIQIRCEFIRIRCDFYRI